MGENRRFYWLKMCEDFFDDDAMMFLEEQENGEKYIVLYLKLCTKSVGENGLLVRYIGENMIPHTESSLARLTRCDIDTVRVGLALFKKIGLVQELETGELYLPQLPEMTGTEGASASRMRKSRAKQKAIDALHCNNQPLQCNNVTNERHNVTANCHNVTNERHFVKKCDTDIESESESESDQEIEIEKDEDEESKDYDFAPQASQDSSSSTFNFISDALTPENVYKYYIQTQLTIKPERFWKYNNRKGWVDNNNLPIGNWKAAYCTMCINNADKGTEEFDPTWIFDASKYEPLRRA